MIGIRQGKNSEQLGDSSRGRGTRHGAGSIRDDDPGPNAILQFLALRDFLVASQSVETGRHTFPGMVVV